MIYAVLADIHSNLTALTAVLMDIDARGGAQEIFCLGDIVGYGPDPVECTRLIQKVCTACVAGNHDWAVTGKTDVKDFNSDAAAAALWTRRQLDAAGDDYLKDLPLVLEQDGFTLVHGSPRNPIWEYLLSEQAATENFAHFQTACCLIGHSHLPLYFESSQKGPSLEDGRYTAIRKEFQPDQPLPLADKRLIINPGSVGQPRDGDPRAAYALYDTQSATFTLRRVAYDIAALQQRMSAAGLPACLSERLAYGR